MANKDLASYSADVVKQRNDLADRLIQRGINASHSELFNTLIPKILQLTPIQRYSIDYVLNGGSNNSNNPSSYNIYDLPITLQPPTKFNYVFKEWLPSNTISIGSTGSKGFAAVWGRRMPDDELVWLSDVLENDYVYNEWLSNFYGSYDLIFTNTMVSHDWYMHGWGYSVGNTISMFDVDDPPTIGFWGVWDIMDFLEGPELLAYVDEILDSEFLQEIQYDFRSSPDIAEYMSTHSLDIPLGALTYCMGHFTRYRKYMFQQFTQYSNYYKYIVNFLKERWHPDIYGYRVELENGLIWYLNTIDLFNDEIFDSDIGAPILVSGSWNGEDFMSSHIGPFFITSLASGSFRVKKVHTLIYYG